MPLKRCSLKGQSGWKWGEKGSCYTGKDGKKKAIKQGVVIEGPKKFQEMASDIYLTEEDIVSVAEEMKDQGYDLGSIVAMCTAFQSKADDIAGYPPNCNEGYREIDGKCVPNTRDT